jgi:hypothetical protein
MEKFAKWYSRQWEYSINKLLYYKR